MILTDLLDNNVNEFGEYPFLFYRDKALSNLDLRDAANSLAAALKQRGIGAGDRVMVCMPNCPEVFIAYQAIMRVGAIVLPVMYVLHPREIGFIARASETSAVITSQLLLANVAEAVREMDRPPMLLVSDLGGDPAPTGRPAIESLQSVMTAATPLTPTFAPTPDDVAVILYTSGTTGQPKGVMLTHRNLYSNAAAAVTLAEEEDGEDEEPGTTIGVLPLAHIYGFTMANTLFMRGSSVVVLPKFDVRAVCLAIQEHRVKRFSAVPAMLYALVTDPATADYDLSSLESVGSGSAPCPVTLIEAFRRRFNADIYEGYGLSEAAPAVSAHRRGETIKPGSVGRPLPGVEIRIADPEGKALPTGDIGELLVRGENITPGYYRNEEATRAALKAGWLHTGDLARLDEDGYLYIVDRKKDLILRGGFNIYPRDLEDLILQHPDVAEVAVIGVPSDRMGEEVVAVVVRKPDAMIDEAGILDFCQERLAKYKTPRSVVFLDALPRNGVGKVLKKSLREDVAGHVSLG